MLCSTFFKLLKIQTKLSCSVGFSNEANVYIHWPYCRRKCNYCNFNKYLEKESEREKMVACLVKEWTTLKTQEGITGAQTIFFGGGTPSLMKPSDVEKILRQAKILWPSFGNCFSSILIYSFSSLM